MIEKGKVRLEGFVTHRFKLDDYKQAFKLVKEKSADVIKTVFEIA
jgi:threonine dehydrogenase-like Zn-dependent dehydrogenase